jgi:putative Holliday junction resolvase
VRILAIDPGTRRIGLALSDEDEMLASPLSTVERKSRAQAVADVARVARAAEVGRLIVGLPLRLDGTEGPEALRARTLGDAIADAAGLGVEYVDERFTTVIADRALGEAGVRGKKKRSVVDQAAAVVLLQGYLDGRRARGSDAWDDDEET